MERRESRQIVSTAMVLARTDFQEADRIITVLTPDHGKVKLIAKGVRRPRSKLAGGIELFSVSDITFLASRSDIMTLVSSRLRQHYGNIVKDIKRTMFGYEVLKRINRITEDSAGPEYFELVQATLEGLNSVAVSLELVKLWFAMQLLLVSGHVPNVRTDIEGTALVPDKQYVFDFDTMSMRLMPEGPLGAGHIKLLRLAYATQSPLALEQVKNAEAVAVDCNRLLENVVRATLRV
jgi:DNA repair protein RecO (recombination protein O)